MSPIIVFLAITIFGAFGTTVILYVRYLYFKLQLSRVKGNSKPSKGFIDEPDVIIIGAGLAGSALATVLARDGRNVVLIDKSSTPQKMLAGQAWMAGCVKAMRELGLEEVTEKFNGVWNTKITVHTQNRDLLLDGTTPYVLARNETGVEAFRNLAFAEPRCRFIHGSVRGLFIENGCVKGINYKVHNDDETKILIAPLTVVADGKGSLFRRVNMKFKPKIETYCSLFSINKWLPKEPDSMHLALTSVGSFFIFPRDKSNTMVVFSSRDPNDKDTFRKAAPELPEWMRGMYKEAIETYKPDRTNALYMPPVGNFVPGVICLGDAYSVRDPCTASGLTIALRDVKRWRDFIQNIPDLYNYDVMHAAQNVFSMERKSYSLVNDLLSHFLMTLFSPKSGWASDGDKLLGAAFEDYLAEAGQPERVASIVTLLDLTETRPKVFFGHLFKIILRSMTLTLKAEGYSMKGFYNAVLVLVASTRTVVPHLFHETVSLVTPWGKPGI